MASISFPYIIHPILTVTVHLSGRSYCLHLADEKTEAQKDKSERWLLPGLESGPHSQPCRDKPDFYSPTPATNLIQVCRLLYCHPSFPLWTCSFPGRRCWACCFSIRSWYSVYQGPSRALHTVPHSSPQQSRSVVLGQYAVVHTQETMYHVFWTFSRRTVVDQPNYATTSDNAQGLAPSHTHSVKAEPPSQRLMPLCSQ